MALVAPHAGYPSLICSSSEGHINAVQDLTLPRRSPVVGFMRHSPQQAMHGHFDQLRQWRSHQEFYGCKDFEAGLSDAKQPALRLPPGSPYVGSQRHAPPSPFLNFSKAKSSFCLPEALQLNGSAIDESLEQCLGSPLPDEAWIQILSLLADVTRISCLSLVARGFPALLKSEAVWAHLSVQIRPAAIAALAPQLAAWLPAWRGVSKLIIPRSAQLQKELAEQMPDLPIEIAWRFDSQLKGSCVEVINHGRSVRRVPGAEEELVVLGDAPLPQTVLAVLEDFLDCRTSSADCASAQLLLPYLEVILDDRSAINCSDGLNDFGIGVTACLPLDVRDLGVVADEVPFSWVVDFTKNSVVLSVDNMEVAKSWQVSGDDLKEGDRVGLRITAAGSIEIYINGQLSAHLTPEPRHCVPQGIKLFPVLDLFGCTAQLSRTNAEKPC